MTFQAVRDAETWQPFLSEVLTGVACTCMDVDFVEIVLNATTANEHTFTCGLCSVPVVVCLACPGAGANKIVSFVAFEANYIVILVALASLLSVGRCPGIAARILCELR